MVSRSKRYCCGLTVVGFGLSPLVTAPLAKNLIGSYGVRSSFLIFGVAFTMIILAISTVLKSPPKNWKPSNWNPPTINASRDREGLE